jgi:hypothetical protein
METTKPKMDLVEKLFAQVLKKKFWQLAREYDSAFVSKLWGQIAKENGGQGYFGGWKWKPDMTIKETLSSMDDYLKGLHSFLPKYKARQADGGKKCY